MWSRVGLVLRFKLRVALRTYLNPANLFLGLISVAGLWVLTRRLVGAAIESELGLEALPPLWFTGLWIVTTAAHLPIAGRLLFRAPECELLLSQPLAPRHFLLERAAELSFPHLLWWLASAFFLYAWIDLGELDASRLVLGLLAGALFALFCAGYQLTGGLIAGHFRSRLGRWLAAATITSLPALPLARMPDDFAAAARLLESWAFWPSTLASRLTSDQGIVGAGGLLAMVGGLALFSDVLFHRWHRKDFSRALTRSQTKRTLLWPTAASLLAALPRTARGLVLRDLTLFLRGAYPNAGLAIVGLGVVHFLFSAAVVDPKDTRLAMVMTQFFAVFEIVIVTWVFAFDWLKFRSEWLGLEQSSPLAPKAQLTASLVTAIVPCLVTAATLGALALLVRPDLGKSWLQLLISLAVLGVVIPILGVQAAWAGFRERSIPEETAFGMTGGFTGMILVLATWLPLWIGLVGAFFFTPAVVRQLRRSLDCIRRLEVTW
ncbi:MAG: hypothetical protein RL885_29665 [Planctomycetota bacterium]